MATNTPYINSLSGLANTVTGAGGLGQGQGIITSGSTWQYPNSGFYAASYPNPSPFPNTTMLTVGSFRLQKIANGYVLGVVRYEGGVVESHYVEGYKEAGELVIAMCVKWELEGKK